jgi:hypothetical protein
VTPSMRIFHGQRVQCSSEVGTAAAFIDSIVGNATRCDRQLFGQSDLVT